jgi:hypothetical protein
MTKNYWRISYYSSGGDYEKSSFIVDANTYRKIQRQLAEGADFLIMEGRPTIKRGQIASIDVADEEIEEFTNRGITYKRLGLPSPEEIQILRLKEEEEKYLNGKNNQLNGK